MTTKFETAEELYRAEKFEECLTFLYANTKSTKLWLWGIMTFSYVFSALAIKISLTVKGSGIAQVMGLAGIGEMAEFVAVTATVLLIMAGVFNAVTAGSTIMPFVVAWAGWPVVNRASEGVITMAFSACIIMMFVLALVGTIAIPKMVPLLCKQGLKELRRKENGKEIRRNV